MSTISDALADLSAGRKSLDEVADLMRATEWPAQTPPAGDYDTLAQRTISDAEPPPEGSFAEVESAYINGTISAEQYAALAAAATGD